MMDCNIDGQGLAALIWWSYNYRNCMRTALYGDNILYIIWKSMFVCGGGGGCVQGRFSERLNLPKDYLLL